MIKKQGTPNKITEVVTGDQEFEQLKSKIAKDNNLKRCSCGQLLAKFDEKGQTMNIQRRNLDIIAKVTKVTIKCPQCQNITSL